MCPLLLPPRGLSRRRFLTNAAAAAGAVAMGCSDRTVTAPSLAGLVSEHLPDPASSGIEHVILVMMENRSFDHFLGWLPGGHGRQPASRTSIAPGWSTRHSPWRPIFRGVDMAIPITPTRARASSTTAAVAMVGSG